MYLYCTFGEMAVGVLDRELVMPVPGRYRPLAYGHKWVERGRECRTWRNWRSENEAQSFLALAKIRHLLDSMVFVEAAAEN